jgi:hypothetical protein
MHTFVRKFLGLGVFAAGLWFAAGVHAAPAGCDEARCVIQAEIDAECPCEEAVNHGRYVTCVTRVVNRGVREGRVAKACRGKITGCYIRSLCGKPERVVLCDGPGDGVGGRCRPQYSEAECTAGGGTVVSHCCESCDAATATPTPSTPAPTSTPAAPVPTATAAATATTVATAMPLVTATANAATPTPAATPSEAGETRTPVSTPIVIVTATALPSATLALPSATPTFVAPIATATELATTTPLTTPTAIGTPRPFPPFIDIEGTPDEGPPPLTVRWISEVSDGVPPYTYRWNFGDGSPEVTGQAFPTHVYERVGEYTATLTVTDSLGLTEMEEYDITVEFE